MKKISLLFIIGFLYNVQIIAQNRFSIKGKIKEVSSGLVYLSYSIDLTNRVVDSSPISFKGSFFFDGKIDDPVLVTLELKQRKPVEDNLVKFFIEPNKLTVRLKAGQFSAAKITGSITQKEYNLYNKMREPFMLKLRPLRKTYDSLGDAFRVAKRNNESETILSKRLQEMETLREKFDPFIENIDSSDYRFYRSYPRSFVTAYTLWSHVSGMKIEALEGYYNKMGLKLQMSSYGKRIELEIEKLRDGSPGTLTKNFSRTDINGDSLSLYSYRGNKYVLLDFWASWCVPCRKANPHLKEVYAIYKDKGLEIIGVSDDDDMPFKWKQAVKDDGLPWRHVLRGLNWDMLRNKVKNENDISEKFGINALPTKILIDKNGVIIGRYNETEDDILDTKLKELFGG